MYNKNHYDSRTLDPTNILINNDINNNNNNITKEYLQERKGFEVTMQSLAIIHKASVKHHVLLLKHMLPPRIRAQSVCQMNRANARMQMSYITDFIDINRHIAELVAGS